jgi:hypothetical protein
MNLAYVACCLVESSNPRDDLLNSSRAGRKTDYNSERIRLQSENVYINYMKDLVRFLSKNVSSILIFISAILQYEDIRCTGIYIIVFNIAL